jgi:hypothetical protein
MKPKNKNPIIQADNQQAGASHFPSRTLLEITNAFIEKQAKKDKSDTTIADFAGIARMFCENYKSVSLNSFLACSRSLDTPADKLGKLFFLWVEELKASKRIRVQLSCYDWPEFIFI